MYVHGDSSLCCTCCCYVLYGKAITVHEAMKYKLKVRNEILTINFSKGLCELQNSTAGMTPEHKSIYSCYLGVMES